MESASHISNWVRCKLGDTVTFEYGKALKRADRNELGQFNVYGSSGIVGKHDEPLTDGPGIVVGRKGSVGSVFFSENGFWPIDTTYYVVPPDYFDVRYLASYLEFLGLDELDTSTAVPGLNRNDAYNVDIVIPPLNEQRRIVAKIEELFSELDKGVESLKTARAQLKTYRQSLLKAAFEGRLTEQWRRDNADAAQGSASVAEGQESGATKLETADQLLQRIRDEREARYRQQLEEWKTEAATWEANGEPGSKPKKPSELKWAPELSAAEQSVLPKIPEHWRYTRLSNVATVGSGMSVSKARQLANPVEVPYLRVANVQRGRLDLDDIKSMQIEQSSLDDLRLRKWDILFNEGGDRDKLGRGWVWEAQIDPCITQNHVFRATTYLQDEFQAKFISYWGNTFGRSYFEEFGKQTINLASINKSVLSIFPVPVPPYEEQKQIVELLESAEAQVTELENALEVEMNRSDTLRQSILKRAFEGKLVPQDPNDEPASVLLERIRAEQEEAPKSRRRRKKVEA